MNSLKVIDGGLKAVKPEYCEKPISSKVFWSSVPCLCALEPGHDGPCLCYHDLDDAA